ncbi:hypothetical protein T439DRAFT_329243 [Meredithblackwellia eburnea MCA 4105]
MSEPEKIYSEAFPSSNGGDTIIVSSDGIKFSVHKGNLRAGSDTLSDMFEIAMDGPEASVDMEEKAEVFEVVLPYLYPKKVPKFNPDLPKMFEVFRAFDKYQIWRGMEAIEHSLLTHYMESSMRGQGDFTFEQEIYAYLFARHIDDRTLIRCSFSNILEHDPSAELLRDTIPASGFKALECRALIERISFQKNIIHELHAEYANERLFRRLDATLIGNDPCVCFSADDYKDRAFMKGWLSLARYASSKRLAEAIERRNEAIDAGREACSSKRCMAAKKAVLKEYLIEVMQKELDSSDLPLQ